MKFYDRDGQEITLEQWMLAQSKPEYCQVAADQVTPDLLVSTIWLGIDYGPGYAEFRPLIFETMLFDKTNPADRPVWRYPDEDTARWGHLAAVREAIARRDAQQN
jgi:hypothetical protein